MGGQPQGQTHFIRSQTISAGLKLIADASPSGLVASFVALAAALYAVFGRLGLLLIGAFVGAVAHGIWDVSHESSGHPSYIDILGSRSVVTARTQTDEQQDGSQPPRVEELPQTRRWPSKLGPASREALEDLENAALRNYVTFNVEGLLSQASLEALKKPCRQSLRHLLLGISSHISHKRPGDAFLGVTIGLSSVLVVFLKELSKALQDQTDSDAQESIRAYLQQTPDSPLANILDRQEQEKKLRSVASDFLEAFLDPTTRRCEPVFVLLREILVDGAFQSVLVNCSRPEWINEWIVYLLEGDEPDIMNVIDAEVGRVARGELKSSSAETAEEGNTRKDEAAWAAGKEAENLSSLVDQSSAYEIRFSDDLTTSTQSTNPCSTPISTRSEWLGAGSNGNLADLEECTSMQGPAHGKQDAEPFTAFEQILQPIDPRSEASELRQLTLFKAKVTILDDLSQDATALRLKPTTTEYLLQIEPLSPHYAGWVISRRYSDFEALHDTVSRIAVISGADFSYKALPAWKGLTRGSHRTALETYLGSALALMPIAECEAMRRFLKKDQAPEKPSASNTILTFATTDAFQNIGKGVKNAFATAPKGAAGSGKAFIDSVNGVFGGTKRSRSSALQEVPLASPASREVPQPERSTLASSQPAGGSAHVEEHLLDESQGVAANIAVPGSSDTKRPTEAHPEAGGPSTGTTNRTSLEMPSRVTPAESQGNKVKRHSLDASVASPSDSSSSADMKMTPRNHRPSISADSIETRSEARKSGAPDDIGKGPHHMPLTTDETRIITELIFTIINEVFGLTSVWTVRAHLLKAAKTFILYVAHFVELREWQHRSFKSNVIIQSFSSFSL